jgi:hypothetical protein
MFRTICSAALVLGWITSMTVAAPAACEGDGCSAVANAKPLNIMQFMREQAASTRVRKQSASTRLAKPRPSYTRATAKVPRHQVIATRKKPGPMPVEAAASFASPEQEAQTPATVGLYNPFNGTADATPAETTGAAVARGPDVQLVDADEFNDIDRKADSDPALSLNSALGNDSQTHGQQANNSWLRWIWSALGSTFAALATAVHQLIPV